MNRWSNNYYTQQVGRDTPSSPQRSISSSSSTLGRTLNPPAIHSRRSSIVKTGGNGVVNLCVFRVAHLTQLTLRSFIERQGVRVLDIEQTSHRGAAYRSFVVAVTEMDAPRLLHKGFWPGLVACRPLQDGDPGRNEVISRRYAREVVLQARKAVDTNSHDDRRRGKEGGAPIDTSASVQVVVAHSYGMRKDEQVQKENKRSSSSYPNANEGKNDKAPTNPKREKFVASKKISLGENGSISAAHKVGMSVKVPVKTAVAKMKRKINDVNTPVKQKGTEATTIKVRGKVSDENELKQALNDAVKEKLQVPTSKARRTRKSSLTSPSYIANNWKQKSNSVLSKKNSNSEGTSEHEIRAQKFHPQKIDVSPYRIPRVNRKYKNLSSHTKPKENSKENFSKPKETQLTWFKPLQSLLRVSSEEALVRLLGPDFDRLMIQENVSDEELFLGVRVLAYCARANVRPNMQQNLVYRICQPQVITLIKEFTRTVEDKYKERAESYFWHLGEFLDLYIVHNIFLQGMLSLFTACLSKILALSYRKYVSDDLVKVYRSMHTKVFSDLP